MTFDPEEIILRDVITWHFGQFQDGNPVGRRFGSSDWLALDRQVMEKAGRQN